MYSNVLVPVVFDPGHDPVQSFEAARALAAKGAQIRILHVLEDVPSYAATHISPEILIQTREALEKRLSDAAKSVEGAVPVLVHGHAAHTIVEYAKDHKVDCIVMTSHKPGLVDYLIGSTADKVVRHAKCSVHVIR